MIRLRLPKWIACAAACAVGAGIGQPNWPAQDQAPPPQTRPAVAALVEALRQLTKEAQLSLQKQELTRTAANFADDFKDPIAPPLLHQKLLRPQHEDAFVDAYIRWQLTNLPGAALAGDWDLTDRQFKTALADLPRMIENPRADEDLINDLVAATRGGALGAPQQEKAKVKLLDLDQRAQRAALFNKPALELRDWLRDHLPKTGERSLLTELERMTALVKAGWPDADAKTRFESLCQASADDPLFTTAQRRNVIDQLRLVIGKRRLFVKNAEVRSDGAITVEYGDTGIYDFEVRRWARSLLKE